MRKAAIVALVCCFGLTGALAAESKVSVTQLVEREAIGLTIYNPAVSLVQENRVLSLSQGSNAFRLGWAGVNVQLGSVRLEVLEDAPSVTLRDTVIPAGDPAALIWHLEAKRSGSFPVSISYYVGGFSWNADYVLTVDEAETVLNASAWANVTNRSGESYEDATVRLVMGDVRLVSTGRIDQGVAGAQRAAPAFAAEADSALPFSREGLSEYTLYTLARKESLEAGTTKRIALAESTGIPMRKVYTYDPRRFGENVAMQYWFDNARELGLGPLPPGIVRAYRRADDAQLALLGEDRLTYVPLGETAKIHLGNAGNVLVESVQTDYERTDDEYSPDKKNLRSYVELKSFRVTIKNRKADAIDLVVRQYIPEQADLASATPDPKQPEVGVLEWELSIEAGETKEIVYRTRQKIYR